MFLLRMSKKARKTMLFLCQWRYPQGLTTCSSYTSSLKGFEELQGNASPKPCVKSSRLYPDVVIGGKTNTFIYSQIKMHE